MLWDSSYPDPAQLRWEINLMQQSILEALLSKLGEAAFVGIYAKGSALKPWDSLLDYVPELSDLDIQLVLQDPDALNNLELAFAIQADFESRFFQRVASPLHLPRPQIQVINRFLQNPTFSPSPSKIVKTLFGKPYEQVHPFEDQEKIRQADRVGLQGTKPEEIQEFPLKFMDMPGKYMFHVLRQLTWRVGPTGSRVLSVLGAGFERAWGSNRTHIYQELLGLGQSELAQDYARFYLRAWDFFRSGYQNTDAAREAGLAGVRVLETGLAIGTEIY